jgi:cell division protein FtsW (lipid II flippase)
MNENLKRIWSYANAVLLLIAIITFMVWPEKYFLSEDQNNMPEIFVMLTLISTAAFLFTFFISSFITIQRSRECNGNVIFYLLGSLLSILFLMVIKVMSDEIAREWLPAERTVYQHGEFWLLISSMGLILVFLFIVGSKKKTLPGE